ncbi:uncharacterized protein LOC108949824 [Ciona intestinalis]
MTNMSTVVYSNYLNSRLEDNITSPVTFCNDDVNTACADVELFACQSCRPAMFIGFIVVVSLLATLILVGNGLVIASVLTKSRKRSTTLDYIKASLAAADFLSGIQIIAITIPNVVWSMYSTPEQIYAKYLRRFLSPDAFAAGCFFMLTITAPLFNLTLLSYTFFSVIKWPLYTRVQGKKYVALKICLVWIWATAAASYAAWFPQVFQCGYTPHVYLYLPNTVATTSTDFGIVAVSLIILSLSYISMSSFNVLSSFFVLRARHNRGDIAQSSTVTRCLNKRDIVVMKNLLLMDFGFSITLSPIFVWFGLFYTGKATTDALLICIYMKMFNSLVNVLIYSTRDEEFRKFITNVCGRRKLFKASPPTSD